MGLIPFLSPISIVYQKPDNTQSCHQSSIQPLLSRSSSALSVVKLVPLPHSPQRSVHLVSHQRRSVTISARPLVTGRVARLPSSLSFKIVRLRSLSSHPPHHLSSRH